MRGSPRTRVRRRRRRHRADGRQTGRGDLRHRRGTRVSHARESRDRRRVRVAATPGDRLRRRCRARRREPAAGAGSGHRGVAHRRSGHARGSSWRRLGAYEPTVARGQRPRRWPRSNAWPRCGRPRTKRLRTRSWIPPVSRSTRWPTVCSRSLPDAAGDNRRRSALRRRGGRRRAGAGGRVARRTASCRGRVAARSGRRPRRCSDRCATRRGRRRDHHDDRRRRAREVALDGRGDVSRVGCGRFAPRRRGGGTGWRNGGRHRRLCRGRVPPGHCRGAVSHHAARAGRRRDRRQDGREPARRQEPRRGVPPAHRGVG